MDLRAGSSPGQNSSGNGVRMLVPNTRSSTCGWRERARDDNKLLTLSVCVTGASGQVGEGTVCGGGSGSFYLGHAEFGVPVSQLTS